MRRLKVTEVRALNKNADDERSLDDRRTWLEITCPKGHKLLVEDHEGGSEAECGTCGARVEYGR